MLKTLKTQPTTSIITANFIGYSYSSKGKKTLKAFNPKTQDFLEEQFHVATPSEIDETMKRASKAFQVYKQKSGQAKASFLRTVGEEVMALGNALIHRAIAETGLPEGRIINERGRMIKQLELFADLIDEGSWVEARIDTKTNSDIRKMLVPLGPVVIFTASNFPLAFSTAGNDMASALASGCPVVIKAHESHLGTNAMVALAVQKAAQKTGMPNGVFSSLNGLGTSIGKALIQHPLTKAVSFTGSPTGGRAIFDLANQREEPIPVFSEMGSVNPVIVSSESMRKRGGNIAKEYASSITLGVGQFCTNPGLLIVKESEHLDGFLAELIRNIEKYTPAPMLNSSIKRNYKQHKSNVLKQEGVKLAGKSNVASTGLEAKAVLASVSSADFIANPALHEEVFGPYSLIVRCTSQEDVKVVVSALKGQLTGTIIAEEQELTEWHELISLLQDKVGRLIFNGVPTGVELCSAMQHGGPYPATSDSRFTSVGQDAIKRFARPITYQNWSKRLLPLALQDRNPLHIWRIVEGKYQH